MNLVRLASNLGLLAVTLATMSFFVNLEKMSKAFSLLNGDLWREILRFVFNVDVSRSIDPSILPAVVIFGGGESRQLSSSL